MQPSSFKLGVQPEPLPLGEVVREAHRRSGLSVAEWNALEDEDREARIAALVAELPLDTEGGDEDDDGGDPEATGAGDETPPRIAAARNRSKVFEAIRGNVRHSGGPMGYDFEGTVHRVREMARDAVVRCADEESAQYLLDLIRDQLVDGCCEVAARRGWESLA